MFTRTIRSKIIDPEWKCIEMAIIESSISILGLTPLQILYNIHVFKNCPEGSVCWNFLAHTGLYFLFLYSILIITSQHIIRDHTKYILFIPVFLVEMTYPFSPIPYRSETLCDLFFNCVRKISGWESGIIPHYRLYATAYPSSPSDRYANTSWKYLPAVQVITYGDDSHL